MSLRRCEWRVCGRGQTTSKPPILRSMKLLIQPEGKKQITFLHMKFWRMKIFVYMMKGRFIIPSSIVQPVV